MKENQATDFLHPIKPRPTISFFLTHPAHLTDSADRNLASNHIDRFEIGHGRA